MPIQLNQQSKDSEDNSDYTPTLIDEDKTIKTSCREYITAEEDSSEAATKESRDSAFEDELRRSQKEVYDLSTLLAWEKDEEARIMRQSSLTRQRPCSFLDPTGGLFDEVMASSPFRSLEHPTSMHEPESNLFDKTQSVSDDKSGSSLGGNDIGYIMVPNGGESENASLKTRILWKLKKLKKRHTKKLTDSKK